MQVQSNIQTSKPTPSSNVPMPSALNNVPVVAQTQVSPPPLTKEATKPIAESANFSEKNIKMKFGKNKRGSKKQIPTILGLLILFVALISGVLLFGQGTGVFAPRATPETTPKNIRISNVTDKTFTISFYTDESTIAFVKYGTDDKTLDKQASDDRDQLSGVVKDYRLHYVTVRNLDPGKNYFYVLGTGSSSFDNEGQPYNLTTAAKPSQSPSNNQTIYGTILKNDGTPAEGAIVYVNSDGIGALSSLVKSSGSWGISLANAFNTEKSNYATMTDGSMLDIKAQGIELDLTNNLQTTVATAQPVINLILDKYDSAASASASVDDLPAVDKAELLADMTTSSSADLMESTESSDASEGGNLTAEASASTDSLKDSTVNDSTSTAVAAIPTVAPTTAPPEILNLSALDETKEASATTIQTSQPQIKATLPANTMIRVVIHSDTAIDETVQTDANGNMVLDVASLGKNLEPGEHTASYTYIDPVSGKEVTKTYNFTVDPKAPRQIAAAADLKTPSKTPSPTVTKSPTPVPSIPYGSGNPFAPTISATPTASPSAAVVSTRSAIVATNSGQYNSGSVGTTVALLLGGLFFVLAGVWSYFLATSFDPKSHD